MEARLASPGFPANKKNWFPIIIVSAPRRAPSFSRTQSFWTGLSYRVDGDHDGSACWAGCVAKFGHFLGHVKFWKGPKFCPQQTENDRISGAGESVGMATLPLERCTSRCRRRALMVQGSAIIYSVIFLLSWRQSVIFHLFLICMADFAIPFTAGYVRCVYLSLNVS